MIQRSILTFTMGLILLFAGLKLVSRFRQQGNKINKRYKSSKYANLHLIGDVLFIGGLLVSGLLFIFQQSSIGIGALMISSSFSFIFDALRGIAVKEYIFPGPRSKYYTGKEAQREATIALVGWSVILTMYILLSYFLKTFDS